IAPERAAPDPPGAGARARADRRRDEPGPALLPCAARLPQPVRGRRHPTSRLYGVRVDVRRVGLGPRRVGRGDPGARAPQAAAGCHHPAARRRWLRSPGRPSPYRGRPPGDHRGRAGGGLHLPSTPGAGRVKSRAGRWLGWLLGLVGVGLALNFITGFPWLVTLAALLVSERWLGPWLRAVQSAVGLALVVVLLLAWGRGWGSLADRLPASLRSRLGVLRAMGTGGRLVWPTAFGLYNWAAQWATYHLVLRAT